ncbi:cupin domain-containing protein [Cyclobacteriaceae bacterium YHN15]|nr:cupin domain-containing protein [Cyclobacteriaceae bacterium YHN15]
MATIDISKIEPKEIIKGFKGKFIHTENPILAFGEVEKGASIPLHSHIHEQTRQVVEGKFQLTVDGETKIYENGLVTVIPSNVVHSGVVLTNCMIYGFFSPVREDYKNL